MFAFFPPVAGVIEYVAVTRIDVTTVTDAHGDKTTTAAAVQLPRCLFEPAQSTERTDPRSPGVTTPAKLYVPPPGVLDSNDVVEVNGERWQVDGEPSRWCNVGLEAALKRYGPTRG